MNNNGINLSELIGEKRLQAMQQNFYDVTGLPNGCLDSTGNLLSYAGKTEPVCMELIRQNPLGLERCKLVANACLETHHEKRSRIIRCHAGMLDGRIPIIIDNDIIGFLVMGQLLDAPPQKEQSIRYAQELGIDPDLYWQELQKVKIVPQEKLEASALLLEFMGSEIATMASANIRLQQEIEGRKKAEKDLARLNHDLMETNKALDEERSLLQESEVRFRLLINEALDAIFLADTSGKFVMVNQQAADCLGYNEQELLALSTEDIEVGHTEEEIVQIFKDLSQGKTHRRKGIHKRKDGTTFPVEVTLSSYTIHDDTFILAIARDMIEHNKAEKEKETLINELQEALKEIKQLSGLLPICSSCKKIRDDQGYWNQIEAFIQTNSDARFSHGICPDCVQSLYGAEDWFTNKKK